MLYILLSTSQNGWFVSLRSDSSSDIEFPKILVEYEKKLPSLFKLVIFKLFFKSGYKARMIK